MKKQQMIDTLLRASSIIDFELGLEPDGELLSLAYDLEDISKEIIGYVEKRGRKGVLT